MEQDLGVVLEGEEVPSLTEHAEAALLRVLETGNAKDCRAAVQSIYATAQTVIENRGAHQDPVALAFLIEMGRHVLKIEEKIDSLLQAPAVG